MPPRRRIVLNAVVTTLTFGATAVGLGAFFGRPLGPWLVGVAVFAGAQARRARQQLAAETQP